MFRKTQNQPSQDASPVERVTSVMGQGINWQGKISGKGGVRIEGIFEGDIAIQGLLVVGETGKVTCPNVRANKVIVAGAVHGGITADKLEIRSTGRVYGNVIVSAFSTEEGAFLRGQVTMEDQVDLDLDETAPEETEASAVHAQPPEANPS
jgi:cytoskeletal protein CcmA (bactofilin family)